MKIEKIIYNGEFAGFNLLPETDSEREILLEYERNNNRSNNSREVILNTGALLDENLKLIKCSFEKWKHSFGFYNDVSTRMEFEKECLTEVAV